MLLIAHREASPNLRGLPSMVNETFVRQQFPNRSPLGQKVIFANGTTVRALRQAIGTPPTLALRAS